MYVIVGRIQLFNVMNSLDGVQDQVVMKLTDFSSFGDFVNSLLYGYQSWTNKNNFVLFFQLSGLRMKKIDDIYQKHNDLSRKKKWRLLNSMQWEKCRDGAANKKSAMNCLA